MIRLEKLRQQVEREKIEREKEELRRVQLKLSQKRSLGESERSRYADDDTQPKKAKAHVSDSHSRGHSSSHKSVSSSDYK